MPPTAKELIEKQNSTLKTLTVLQSEMKSAREQADEIAISRGIDTKAYDSVMKSVKPASIKIQTGESIILSPEDQLDLVNLRPERFNFFGSLSVDNQQSKLSSQARMKLNAKYGAEKVNNIEKLLFPSADFNSFGATLNSPILENISGSLRDSQVSAYSEILSSVMQSSGMVAQPSAFDIPQGDLKEGEYKAKYDIVLGNYREIAPDEISEISNAILSGPFAGKAIAFPGSAGVPDRYYLNVTPESGKAPTPIQINRQEFEYLTLTQAPQASSFTGAPSLLLKKGTTNLNSSGDYMSTYFTPSDFSYFESSNYTLRGDLEKDLANPNLSFMKLYLIDKNNGNLVDEAWVRGLPFDITLSNGSPNSDLERASQGFNSQNVQLIFNRPVN